MKIRIVAFVKHFRFSVHNIHQATQTYNRIQTDGQTDLNYHFEPVSPVSHSVKFSWFRSEFIVFKVEMEDRNLVLTLLRKIPGSTGNNIGFPLQLYTRMHGFKYAFIKIFPASPQTSPPDPRSILSCTFDSGFALNSRALCAIDWFGLRHQFTLQHVYWPLPQQPLSQQPKKLHVP